MALESRGNFRSRRLRIPLTNYVALMERYYYPRAFRLLYARDDGRLRQKFDLCLRM